MAWLKLRCALVFSLSLLTLSAPAAPQAEQQEPPAATFFGTVDVEIATVEVFVTDRQGNPVTGLTRDDFELRVDGQPVPITNFYAEVGGRPVMVEREAAAAEAESSFEGGTRPPRQRLKTVIFVDHTNIRPANRKRVLSRMRDFVERNLRPEDAVAVVSLTDRLRIHSDFLNDPATVGRIFDEIERISFRTASGEAERRQIFSELARGHSGGGISPFRQDPLTGYSDSDFLGPDLEHRIRAYAQTEYSQTRTSLDALTRFLGSLGGVPGRKALIYVSDGVVNRPGEDLYIAWRNAFGSSSTNPNVPHLDPNSDYTRFVGNLDLTREIQQMADAANAAGVTFYALDAEGDHSTVARSALLEGGAGTTEVLSTLEANVRDPLEFISAATGGRRIQASDQLAADLASVATDFDTFYSLGFRPAAADPGTTQRIEVRLRGDAGKRRIVRHREERRSKSAEQRAGEAVLAAIYYNATDNPLELSIAEGDPVRREDGNMVLPLTLEVPVAKLALVPTEQTSEARLSIFVTVKDKTGDARDIQKVPFHLRIPADKLDEAMQNVAHHTLQVILRPGDQQVAVGVRDEVAATLSTIRVEVAGTV